MSNPLVTVLMPIKDTNEIWLRTAIRTSALQTYDNLDLVLIDNGSTRASTIDVIKQASERWPDRVILAHENGKTGTAYALDAGLKAADPDTVYFTKLDSDDLCHRDREKNRVELFEKLPPQIALIYDNYMQLVYEPRPYLIPITLRPYDYRVLLESNYIHGNSMWKASVYDKIPRTFVYEDYEGKANKHGEDYNLWLAITDHWDGYWMNADPAFTWTYRTYRTSKYMSDRRGVDYCRALLQSRAKERRGL